MVFQSSLLYPHLTARQNIVMSLKRSGLDKAEIEQRDRRGRAMLDVGAPARQAAERAVSGGERQRVATAKAIVRQPAASCSTSRSRRSTRRCG